ncbi:polyketide synthase [Apiospora sp. TS-2023a]
MMMSLAYALKTGKTTRKTYSLSDSLGLLATTVDLVLIQYVGYVAEQDSALGVRWVLFEKRQWTPIDDGGDHADQALKQLHIMHKSGRAEIGVLNSICVVVVSAQFAKILRLDTAPESGRPLLVYGLQSLSAVELRNRIRVKFGLELKTLDITNTLSLVAFVREGGV